MESQPAPTPVVSVILPVRNAASTVRVQLEALASQECDIAWELLVADNGSTDDTISIVEEMLPRIANSQIVDASEKRGVSYARNVASHVAKGDLLLFCDGDDEVDPGWIAAMARAASQADILTGPHKRERVNPPGYRSIHRKSLQLSHGFLPNAGAANCGIRTSVFRALGGFDETYFLRQDIDLSWRAQLAGYEIGFVPDAVVHYRERTTLRGVFRQSYRYGVHDPHLFRDYRDHGMPAPKLKDGFRRWARLIIATPRFIVDPSIRRWWMRRAGRGLGRIIGSMRWKTLYL